jgi:hypothetical protein
MTRTAYLSVLCDADWGVNPPCRVLPHPGDLDPTWAALLARIPVLRARLARSSFTTEHGPLPITWLLRADRQVLELFRDPAFCFQKFEATARSEEACGSEIGWHPHLYRWEENAGGWRPYLRRDDDLEILAQCLEAARRLADVRGVRTGWNYHSNTLMAFFDSAGLLADASAIPGSVHGEPEFHDWRGAPRAPYFPSRSDYRRPRTQPHHDQEVEPQSSAHGWVRGRPAGSPASALRLIEMPVLARRLSLPFHLARYGVRTYRALTQPGWRFPDWTSSGWQGVLVCRNPAAFSDAVRQTLAEAADAPAVFLTTYFHLREMLSDALQDFVVQNLERLSALTRQFGLALKPVTLTTAATAARQQLLRHE